MTVCASVRDDQRITWLTKKRKWKKKQVLDNNQKVKKVKMAKVYTELKNMDACDDNYQVRQILIKFSYLRENFGVFSRRCRGYDLFWSISSLNFLKRRGTKTAKWHVKSNTLFTVECHLREGNGHRNGLVYCQQVI